MISKIEIKGMEFYAYHGCFAEEKIIGTRFKVDAVLYANILSAAQNDDLSKTINYTQVYAIVKKVMFHPSNIIESLAYHIVTNLKDKFPMIEKLEITVYKLNPSIGGKTESVSVTIAD